MLLMGMVSRSGSVRESGYSSRVRTVAMPPVQILGFNSLLPQSKLNNVSPVKL